MYGGVSFLNLRLRNQHKILVFKFNLKESLANAAKQYPMSDPRVFFASERTLLAWIRSGLTIIALGFIVARFGLLLTLATSAHVPADGTQAHWVSSAIGIVLVVLGSISIAAALYNHRVYVQSLPPDDIPRLPLPWLTSFLAAALAISGSLLAAYLAFA